jgi:hypothetical protein
LANHFVKDKTEIVVVYVVILATDEKIHQICEEKATIRTTHHSVNQFVKVIHSVQSIHSVYSIRPVYSIHFVKAI